MNKAYVAVGKTAVFSALAYLAAKLPFALTGFPGTEQLAGPSVCAALLLGLIAGRPGAAGCTIGALAAAALTGRTGLSLIWAAAGTAWLAFVPYSLWYAGRRAEQAALRNGKDFARFAGVLAAGALGNACFASIGMGVQTAFSSFAFTLFWGLVAGAPLMILLISILGVRPACPGRALQPWDLEISIPAETERIGEVNDQVEELGMRKGLGRKEIFRLMACLEEILLRILQNAQVSGDIEIRVLARETVMILVSYPGNRYNPLRMDKKEELEDLAGLRILMQMSLRASCRRQGGRCEIRIVV